VCNCWLAVSNKVILSAVVGSLSCALLLVVALGVTYRFVRQSTGRRSSRHISPITAIEEQIYAQRSAPPPYQEAMATSRPFDDYRREIADRSNPTAATSGSEHGHADDPSDTSALVRNEPASDDDDLIDAEVDETPADGGGGNDGENIVIALTRWHRRPPKPSDDSSESSLIAVDDSCPTDTADVCNVRPDVEPDNSSTASAQTCETTQAEDDDNRPLLIC